jgi:tRNA (guanine37-N1)-methyltransferase
MIAEMLTVDVITLFPEMFAPAIGLSIVGRAVERGLVSVWLHNLLDYCEGSGRADDAPYGGGPGMVLRLEPLARALDDVLAAATPAERRALVLPTPAGKRFAQPDAERFAGLDRLVLICGHYEGVDERLAALYPVEELSLGDFVLTGGEIPSLAILDATVRLLEGAISPESAAGESFARGSDELDYPAYTRPPRFRGVQVPDVLLSGDHAKIAAWRREESRRRAARRRDAQ